MMTEGLKDLGTLPEKAKGIWTRCQRKQEKIGHDAREDRRKSNAMPEKIRDPGTMLEKQRRSRHAVGDNKGDPDAMSERIGKQIRESTGKRPRQVSEKSK